MAGRRKGKVTTVRRGQRAGCAARERMTDACLSTLSPLWLSMQPLNPPLPSSYHHLLFRSPLGPLEKLLSKVGSIGFKLVGQLGLGDPELGSISDLPPRDSTLSEMPRDLTLAATLSLSMCSMATANTSSERIPNFSGVQIPAPPLAFLGVPLFDLVFLGEGVGEGPRCEVVSGEAYRFAPFCQRISLSPLSLR